MRLINETKFDTTDLKKYLIMICKDEGMEHRHLKVLVKKGLGSGTYCRYRSWDKYKVDIKIRSEDLARINFVFIHELGHMRGLKHREMLYRNGYWFKHKEEFKPMIEVKEK